MLYELRIYTLNPRAVPDFYETFGKVIDKRQELSRMVGLFHCEFGALNRVMHIWEYENARHREETRQEANSKEWWPPRGAHLLRRQVTKLATTPAFRLQPRIGEYGSVYEFRTYTLLPGKTGEMEARWSENIADREKLSPLAAVFMTESGPLNEWIHVWPYKDLNERAEIRARTRDMPNWPSPGTGELIDSQESEIWIPGPYSLMK